jgi:glucose-6-phosphate isomerase
MYRNLAKTGADRRWLADHRLRYDITVVPPADLCGECVKTKGHYHPANPRGCGYPEIYEVCEGEVHYLLQTRVWNDIVLIEATAGDIVVIPPGYGHVSINPSRDETLVMANIVSTAFESEYGEYEARRGAAYYEMEDRSLVKNPRYGHIPAVRRIRALQNSCNLTGCNGPIYDLIGNERALSFLNTPERSLPALRSLLKR